MAKKVDVDAERLEREITRCRHVELINQASGVRQAIDSGAIPAFINTTVSEALVLGLLLQGVKKFFAVFGHGSTEIAEVLRIYQQGGLCKVYALRSEIEASHAAAALNWMTGEKAGVITSIGPGALHALAASLVPASDGLGVWYLLGDETTEDEGLNMQQIPVGGQGQFLKLFSQVGEAYSLHTPLALPAALQKGMVATTNPYRPGPYFLLLPMNIQSEELRHFNLQELPRGEVPYLAAARDDGIYELAASKLIKASRVVVKIGGGGRSIGKPILEFLDLVDGVAVTTPIALGAVPAENPRCMFVGGSKGSICGNYAMENADFLVAIGSRFVCQSDCSRTGYPKVKNVINISNEIDKAMHYNKTIALLGDAELTLGKLNDILRSSSIKQSSKPSTWLEACTQKRLEWQSLKQKRYDTPCLFDPVWGKQVLTEPAAIHTALEWAEQNQVRSVFDAGDVQANGFQLAEVQAPNQVITESGASYMGFAVSSLLATGIANDPFYALAITGDGSFTMNPQVLIDGVEHKTRGCILLLDNRRMGAITGLQMDQYGRDFATHDSVEVNYSMWAGAIKGLNSLGSVFSTAELSDALDQAWKYPGLSFIHLPVYFGPDPLGGLGVYGRWNVGNWSRNVQTLRHKIGL